MSEEELNLTRVIKSPPSSTDLKRGRQVLTRTMGLIGERGWIQEQLRGPKGEVCLIGAFRLAATDGSYINFIPSYLMDDGVRLAYRKLLLEAKRRGAYTLPLFNDEVARSIQDVFDLIAAAIRQIRE